MTTDMMKREAKVLRECADKIEELDGFGQHVDDLRATADTLDPYPTIDRSLRGWVLVTDEGGDQTVRWATEIGLRIWEGYIGSPVVWDSAERNGWTIEPFPTGYTIDDIETVLNEIFDEEWARNKDDEMLWPGIAHVVTRLRRLKEEA
jgi:hypothetical protein